MIDNLSIDQLLLLSGGNIVIVTIGNEYQQLEFE